MEMTSIKLILRGARVRAEVDGVLTAGMVGIPVSIEYDDAWKNLTKKLVCRSSDRYDPPEKGAIRIVPDIGTTAAVAYEVMIAGRYLYLGVEGYNTDGSLVMPTTWVECGKILPGANANADSPEEAPRVWAQLEADVAQLKTNAATDINIRDAVAQYMAEHPVEIPDPAVPVPLETEIQVGSAAYQPTWESGSQFGYYWESGYTRACISPLAFHAQRGAIYTASLADNSNYQFFVHVYRCSAASTDFSYTPNGSIVWFPGTYERILDTGFMTGTYSYTPDEDNLIIHVGFRRKSESSIMEDDLQAIGALFSLEYTGMEPEYLPANMGSENSNRYLVTDEDGNIVAGHAIGGESSLPDYWTEYLEAKLPEIREKVVEGGANTDAFLYFTDHHIGCKEFWNNANNTGYIIDFVRKHTPVRNVFFGGDILNTTANQTHDHVMNWLWEFHDDYIRRGVYPVIGNHEISTQYDTAGNHISFDEAYSILFRDAEQTADTGKKLYYFLDNPAQKIRYIVLDTESETISSNTAQLQWFIDALADMGDGWTAVMFAHNFSTVTAYDNPENPIITQIAGAYNSRTNGSSDNASWDFTDAGGEVACLICGHRHLDGSGVNNGILVINVTTDCGANADNASPDNAAGANRKAGDVSEHAVELFFLNTADKTVETIRLGYGEDRTWNYGTGNGGTDAPNLENAAVILGAPVVNANTNNCLHYYHESGAGQATLNPVYCYMEAGSTLNVSLPADSGYLFAVHRYSCAESYKETDFSVTESTSKNFGVPTEKLYDSGWKSGDFTLEIAESCVIAFLFRNTAYSALTADDTAAIRKHLTATVTN